MARRSVILAGCAAALAARAAFAQAVLPTAYTGPWMGYAPPAGWVFSGLGSPDYTPDYDGQDDGAAKFDGTGDFISIHFEGPSQSVSFWIRGLTVSGGTFRVDQSVDGTNWTQLASYAPPPSNATFQTFVPLLHARHVRFIYSERVTGNVGIDGISIAKSPFFVIKNFYQIVEQGRVTVEPTEVGRRYALYHTTNLANPEAWIYASDSYASSRELELIDPVVQYPRYYRVRDITPPAGKNATPARRKSPWRK